MLNVLPFIFIQNLNFVVPRSATKLLSKIFCSLRAVTSKINYYVPVKNLILKCLAEVLSIINCLKKALPSQYYMLFKPLTLVRKKQQAKFSLIFVYRICIICKTVVKKNIFFEKY